MLNTYKVRMTCGHIESRKMREATAGIPWSPEAMIDGGCICALCRAQEQTRHIFEQCRKLDAGTHGPWCDNVGKFIHGTDAEHVVERVYRAMPGGYTWVQAFFAVMNGDAAKYLENPNQFQTAYLEKAQA